MHARWFLALLPVAAPGIAFAQEEPPVATGAPIRAVLRDGRVVEGRLGQIGEETLMVVTSAGETVVVYRSEVATPAAAWRGDPEFFPPGDERTGTWAEGVIRGREDASHASSPYVASGFGQACGSVGLGVMTMGCLTIPQTHPEAPSPEVDAEEAERRTPEYLRGYKTAYSEELARRREEERTRGFVLGFGIVILAVGFLVATSAPAAGSDDEGGRSSPGWPL